MSLPPGATLVSGSIPDSSQLPPGAKLVSGDLPSASKPAEQPGFLSQAWDKAVSMFPSKEEALRALGGSGVTAYHLATNPKEAFAKLAQESPGFAQAQEYLRSRQTGSSIPRSALNAAGTLTGVDPAAQEAAAAQGNTAGVAADAVVPAVAALAGYGLHLGAPKLAAALPSAEAVGTALRTPEGKLIPPVKIGAKLAGAAAGHALGIPGAGELGGYLVGDKLADMVVPARPGAMTAAERRAVERAAAKPPKPLSPIYGPQTPTPEQLAEGRSLSNLLGEKPSGITVLPEPRAGMPGDVNLMGSVPRGTLQDLALAGKPGAGAQLQNLGQPVLYAPSGAGISNVKSAVALRDLLEAKPNMTLNPVGAGGARQIVPGNEFESLFGPEHKEVGDLAEWETGNREGVKVGSDLDKAAKSMFGGKSFDALTQAQKAHILRIAQTQVAVP